jgi:hypothetical protein
MEKRCTGSITVREDGFPKDEMWPGVSLSQEVRRRNLSFCCQGMWTSHWGAMVVHLTVGGSGSVSDWHVHQALAEEQCA